MRNPFARPAPEPVVEAAPEPPPFRINASQIREAVQAGLLDAYKRELVRQVRSQAGDVSVDFIRATCSLNIDWDDVREPIVIDGRPVQWTHEEL